jgi:hypothetical protein
MQLRGLIAGKLLYLPQAAVWPVFPETSLQLCHGKGAVNGTGFYSMVGVTVFDNQSVDVGSYLHPNLLHLQYMLSCWKSLPFSAPKHIPQCHRPQSDW